MQLKVGDVVTIEINRSKYYYVDELIAKITREDKTNWIMEPTKENPNIKKILKFSKKSLTCYDSEYESITITRKTFYI